MDVVGESHIPTVPRYGHRSFPGPQRTHLLQIHNGKIIIAEYDGLIHIYDIATGHLRARLESHTYGVDALLCKGSTLIAGGMWSPVRIWDLETFKLRHIFYGHGYSAHCLQIVEPELDAVCGLYDIPYCMLVTGSSDRTLRVWKVPVKDELSEAFSLLVSRFVACFSWLTRFV
jgi:F-box and WD-40 domain protein CDC4